MEMYAIPVKPHVVVGTELGWTALNFPDPSSHRDSFTKTRKHETSIRDHTTLKYRNKRIVGYITVLSYIYYKSRNHENKKHIVQHPLFLVLHFNRNTKSNRKFNKSISR